MDETKTYSTSWGWLLILIFLFFFAFGGGLNRGWGNQGGYGYGYGYGTGEGGCGRTSNCEVERRSLITAADTNYRIIEQAQATRETVQASAATTNAKIDFYEYQNLRDRLSEEQRKNMMLQNQLYSDAKFNELQAQLSSISCNMLRRPDVTGVGVSCPSAAILNGLGINSLNGGCGCGSCGNGFVA